MRTSPYSSYLVPVIGFPHVCRVSHVYSNEVFVVPLLHAAFGASDGFIGGIASSNRLFIKQFCKRFH
jgi:hypothetical protein